MAQIGFNLTVLSYTKYNQYYYYLCQHAELPRYGCATQNYNAIWLNLDFYAWQKGWTILCSLLYNFTIRINFTFVHKYLFHSAVLTPTWLLSSLSVMKCMPFLYIHFSTTAEIYLQGWNGSGSTCSADVVSRVQGMGDHTHYPLKTNPVVPRPKMGPHQHTPASCIPRSAEHLISLCSV